MTTLFLLLSSKDLLTFNYLLCIPPTISSSEFLVCCSTILQSDYIFLVVRSQCHEERVVICVLLLRNDQHSQVDVLCTQLEVLSCCDIISLICVLLLKNDQHSQVVTQQHSVALTSWNTQPGGSPHNIISPSWGVQLYSEVLTSWNTQEEQHLQAAEIHPNVTMWPFSKESL